MNNEKKKHVLADQREEGINFVALAIFKGVWSYKRFLATNSDVKAKKYVDDWLNGQLAKPENRGKIIPGFNG